MCTTHDNRILKPQTGEMISVNANSLTDSDCKTVNEFILMARKYSELKKLIVK